MASDSESRKFFSSLPEVPPEVTFGGGQNLLALQFQYIVTLVLQIAIKHLKEVIN